MSTVPEVLAAVAALGAVTLPNSQVIDGTLGAVTTTSGRLLLVGDQDFEVVEEFDSLGGNTTKESYVVPCTIAVDVATPDQVIADGQAWSDYEAFKAAIEAAPQLGLQALFSLNTAVVGTQMTQRLATSNGRHAAIRFGIDVFAAND